MQKQLKKAFSIESITALTGVFVLIFTIQNYEITNVHYWFSCLGYAASIIFIGLTFNFLSQKSKFWTDAVFALSITYYLYSIWPHTFFDDAGFIMRYLDQLQYGDWFQFNHHEAPVYGISGFIHGLYGSILVKFSGLSPEAALHFSNLTGVALTAFLLVRIFRKLLPQSPFIFAIVSIILLYSKYLCDVYFQGMETPLHVAIVLAALYFLISEESKWFYLFSAWALISKLDVVPVIAVLFAIFSFRKFSTHDFKTQIKQELKLFLLYFALPICMWLVFSFFFFGSPLPQSAKAKMLYHSGAIQSTFPFLEVFIQDNFRRPLLILFIILLIKHLALWRKKGTDEILLQFVFGWMFMAIMVLFHFYNPNERMLWYYALPDLLLVSQCVLSLMGLGSSDSLRFSALRNAFMILGFVLVLKFDTDGARYWMHDYLDKVERERYELGTFVADLSNPSDTLLAWHGLISRPFPGYVIDGTGLNSKLALSYKLNRDSLIETFHPQFIVHHAQDFLIESFSSHRYRIVDVFGDVTLQNYEPWILWEKPHPSKPSAQIKILAEDDLARGNQDPTVGFLKAEGEEIALAIQTDGIRPEKLWVIFERDMAREIPVKMHITAADSLVFSNEWVIPSSTQKSGPSKYTYTYSLDFMKDIPFLKFSSLEIEFIASEPDRKLKISRPFLEYHSQ